MDGSVRISSTKRFRPAKPLENISAKLASFRMGLTKDGDVQGECDKVHIVHALLA